MKPPAFRYTRASSLAQALDLVAQAGEDAKFLAGGQSLMPLLALRMSRPSHLVDIDRLPGLDLIREVDGGLAVGALVRHAALERSAGLVGPWQALRDAAAHIGHHPIRLRGTFGGSIAHADPAAELPVVATAMSASFLVRSSGRERTIPAAEFFAGPLMTALEPDELLVEALFPAPFPQTRSAFEEFSPRAGDFALASAAVALALDGSGRVADARIALGGIAGAPSRTYEAEAALNGEHLADDVIREAAGRAAATCEATNRAELVATLVRRALRRLKGEQ
ncbi:FAD binding domain-containing protein [Nonomuraea sp. B5E05]|uniref:FAD binding domain-containing protein n=1 Tax=Nonomuraea sp. B5E05 TaxID=3153569 RepID=UPI0032611818